MPITSGSTRGRPGGCCGWSTTTWPARAPTWSRSRVTASRLGILNTSAYGFAYLARAEWLSGAWDDALLHAERAVAINLQADFGFMQSAVLGVAVLVPAGRGDWAAAASYLASMNQNRGRLRTVGGRARHRQGPDRRGPRPARRRGHRPRTGVPHSGTATRWTSRVSGRGRTCTPMGWRRVGRFDEAASFLVPHEELAAAQGQAIGDRQAGPVPRPGGGDGGSAGAGGGGLRGGAGADRRSAPAVRAGPDRACRRRASCAARASDGGPPTCWTPPSSGSSRSARRPTPSARDHELAASGLTPASRTGRDRVGLTAQELVVARLAAGGPQQPGDRRRAGGQHQDGRVPPAQCVRQAGRHLAATVGRQARRLAAGGRLTRPSDGAANGSHSPEVAGRRRCPRGRATESLHR